MSIERCKLYWAQQISAFFSTKILKKNCANFLMTRKFDICDNLKFLTDKDNVPEYLQKILISLKLTRTKKHS
jgi:hypothetical protein